MSKTLVIQSCLCGTSLAFLLSCRVAGPLPLPEKAPPARLPATDFIHKETELPSEGKKNKEDEFEKIVTRQKTKKGRIVTTIYSGAVLVREVAKRQGVEVVRITISGNATIRHENITIRARRMTIEDNRKGSLSGHVHIIDHESRTHIFARRAVYDRDREFVSLEGNPYMLIYPKSDRKSSPKKRGNAPLMLSSNRPALVTCKRMVRLLDKKESRLLGDVRIHQEPWNLLGDEGISQDGKDRILIRTNPMIFGRDQFMVGDHLEYRISQKQAVLDSRVVFLSRSNVLLPEEEKKQKKANPQNGSKTEEPANRDATPKGQILKLSLEEFGRLGGRIRRPETLKRISTISVLSAKSLAFAQAQEGRPARTDIKGNVLLTRADLQVRSPHLVALGEDFHTLYTNSGVEMKDKRRGMYVKARVMDYRIADKLLRLEGSPSIDFYKKGTDEVESTLRAAVIERDFAKGRMLARGKVRLSQGGDFEATGEQARYKEKEGVIILEGAPGVVSAKNVIRAEKILYYTKKKRIFLYRRIRAELGSQEFYSYFIL